MVFVDLDGDGILDGYIYRDEYGRIHYRDFSSNDVIIEADRIYKDPDPLPVEEIGFIEFIIDEEDRPQKDKTVTPTDNKDCDPVSEAEVKKLVDDLDKVKNINEAFDLLRKYVQTNSDNEIGIMIDTDMKTIKYFQGNESGMKIDYNSKSYISAHVHSYLGYRSPSEGDIYQTLYIARSSTYTNCKGIMIFAADGSEYFIYIDDRDKARKANMGIWHVDKNGYFLDEEMRAKEREYYELLIEQGYSEDQAFEYAMAQLIKEYAPGLKLYKKSDKEEDFKQMVPEKDEKNKITPQICK